MNRTFSALCICLLAVIPAFAQNPVQWSGSVPQSVSRAQEQSLPLLFWVSESADRGDDDDLRDAQEDSFRDRTVVAMIHKHFIPVRVSRNSRVIEEARQLGLPATIGLFAAVLSPDGKLLGEIGPGEIADPHAFAEKLAAIFTAYRDEFYQRVLRPLIENAESNKGQARLAAQTVWRLTILSADGDMVALAQLPNLSPTERSRLYNLLGSLGTRVCADFLLDLTTEGDKAAAAALAKAETGILEHLAADLPTLQGEVTPRQRAAYTASARLCRLTAPRDDAWWDKATAEERAAELERLARRSASVLEYWNEHEGRWR